MLMSFGNSNKYLHFIQIFKNVPPERGDNFQNGKLYAALQVSVGRKQPEVYPIHAMRQRLSQMTPSHRRFMNHSDAGDGKRSLPDQAQWVRLHAIAGGGDHQLDVIVCKRIAWSVFKNYPGLYFVRGKMNNGFQNAE